MIEANAADDDDDDDDDDDHGAADPEMKRYLIGILPDAQRNLSLSLDRFFDDDFSFFSVVNFIYGKFLPQLDFLCLNSAASFSELKCSLMNIYYKA